MGIMVFLIMGNAGFKPSTVVYVLSPSPLTLNPSSSR